MAVSGSSVNIVVTATAARALKEMSKLQGALGAVSKAAMNAGAGIELLDENSTRRAKGITDLAASVELLNNSTKGLGPRAAKAATGVTALGEASAGAAAGMGAAGKASTALATNIAQISAATALSSAALANLAKASAASAAQQARTERYKQASTIKTADAQAASEQRQRRESSRTAAQLAADAERVRQAQARTAATAEVSNNKVAASQASLAASQARASAQQQAAALSALRSTEGMNDTLDKAAAKARKAAREMTGLTRSMYDAGYEIRKAGSQAQWAGRQIAMNLGAPFALATGMAAKWYLEQDLMWASVKKVYGDGSDSAMQSLERVRDTLNKMSIVYGKNREEIYETTEAFAALGLTGGNLARAVQNALETSVVGNMDLAASTEGLIAVQQQWQLSVADTREALMKMNAISNRGPAVLRDLIDAMQRVGSVARTVGLTIEETAGLIETLVPSTGSAATAGAGLRSILSRIANVTPKAAEGLAQIGVSTERWRKESVGVVERLMEVAAAFQTLDETSRTGLAVDIFTRYQVGRSLQIVETIGEEWGEFQKALRNVGVDTAPIIRRLEELGYVFTDRVSEAVDESRSSLEVWNDELSLFLAQSEAMAAKQQWQRIRGAMADAIKPLIPTIIMMIALIATLVEKFAALSPETRKNVLLFGLLIAVVGPLLMFFATLAVLLGVAMLGFAQLAAGLTLARTKFLALTGATSVFALLFGRLGGITKDGQKKINEANDAGAKRFAMTNMLLAALVPTMFARMFKAVWAIVTLGWIRTAAISALGALGVTAAFARIGTIIRANWALLWFVVRGQAKAGLAALGKTMAKAMSGLGSLAVRALASLGSVIARLIIVPVAAAVAAAIVAVAGFLALPVWAVVAIVAAVAAAGVALWKWHDDIGRMFTGMVKSLDRAVGGGLARLAERFVGFVRTVGEAFAWLPRIVMAALRGVLRVVEHVGRAIYNALSYLNPFVRHSPSLVESVDAGMDIVAAKYGATASAIRGHMASAYAAVARFRQVSAGVVGRADDIRTRQTYSEIEAVDPASANAYAGLGDQAKVLESDLALVTRAIKEQEGVVESWSRRVDAATERIDGMNKVLEQLRERADSVGDALRHAQEQLDFYSSAPLTGMQAMSDAIFENEMAQKKLRLELLQLEQAGESVDAVADKFSKLQGEIETLSGEKENLRQAGAGSDILSQYDAMIEQLREQQKQMATGEVSRVEKAQKELEELARRGEMLDLEQSLKFDPLTRQIDKAADSMREIPFEQALAGTIKYRGEVDRLTVAHEAANAAVESQEQAIKAATEQRDLLQESMEREQEKLDSLQSLHSELSDALSAVKQEMDSISTSAQEVTRHLEDQARAAESAAGAIDDLEDAFERIEPAGGLINDEMIDLSDIDKELDDQLKRIMEDFEFSLSDLNPFSGWWDGIKTWFGEKMEGVGNWFSELPGKIGEGLGSAWTSVTEWFGELGSGITGWFGGLWPDIKIELDELPGNIGGFIMELPSRLGSAMAYLAGYMTGTVGAIFAGAFAVGERIVSYFREDFFDDVAEITGIVVTWVDENIVQPVGRFFTEKVPDMFWAVIDYFTSGKFAEDAIAVKDTVVEWARTQILDPIGNFFTQTIPNTASAIANYFTSGQWLEDSQAVFTAAVEWGGNILGGIAEGISNAFGSTVDWAKRTLVDPFIQGFKDAMGIASPSTVMMGMAPDIVEGLWQGILGQGRVLYDKIKQWAINNIPGPIKKALDIQSPSRLTMGLGVNIAEGLAQGILSGTGSVRSAADALSGSVQVSQPEIAAGVKIDTGALKGWLDYQSRQEAGLEMLEAAFSTTFGDISAQVTKDEAGMHHISLSANAAWGTNLVSAMTRMGADTTTITRNSTNDMASLFTTSRDVLTSLAGNTEQNVTSAFSSMSTSLGDIFNRGIRPTFEAFGPMLGTTEGWFSDTVTNIGSIWDNIRPGTADPARFVINDVYNDGIRVAWNRVNEWLDLPALEAFAAPFATGGEVRGPGTGTSDSILARLSNNEHVVTDREVRGAGGHAAIERQRALWRSGRKEHAMTPEALFAKGGPVRLPAFALGGPVDTSLWNAVKTAFPGATLNSAHRPGHAGFHGTAQAVDLGGPMQQIANWIFDRYPDSAQLIWGPGPSLYFGNKNQAQVRAIYTEAEMANHYDHVHWAHTSPISHDGKMISADAGSAGGAAAYVPMVQRVEEQFRDAMDKVGKRIPAGKSGTASAMPQLGFDKFDTETWKFLKGKSEEYDASSAMAGNVAWNASAGVEQWRDTVRRALNMVGQPQSLDNVTLRRMGQESGGDPNAINLWDSNAARGTPSKGLMQVIDPTFQDHKYPGHNDIWAPLDNILASMRYTLARYGSLPAGYNRAGGYDQGGWLPDGGVGFNASGKPEPVLTNRQWNSVERLSLRLGSSSFWDSQAEAIAKANEGLPAPEIALPPALTRMPDPGTGTPGDGTPGTGTPGTGTPGTGTPGGGSGGSGFPTDLAGQLAFIADRIHQGAAQVGAEMAPVLQKQAAALRPELDKAAASMGSAIHQAAGMALRDPHGALRVFGDAFHANARQLAPHLEKATRETVPALVQSIQSADEKYRLSADQQSAVMQNLIAANDDLRLAVQATISASQGGVSGSATLSSEDGTTIIEINGNLEFPNVRSGNDVQVLVDNLKALTGR